MTEMKKYNNLFALTYYFQEIFPDYETFKKFTDSLEIYSTDDTISEEFNKYLFEILFAHFYNNNVRYDSIDCFELEFGNVYKNNFKMLQMRKATIDKIYQLTDDDLKELSTSLTNLAYNPNTEPDNPLKPLNYVSNQSYSVANMGKLNAYITAINSIPDLDAGNIISKFEWLFIQIYPDSDLINLFINKE